LWALYIRVRGALAALRGHGWPPRYL